MPQPSISELQALLQVYLNCVELWRTLKRRVDDPYVKEALQPLIDEGQGSLAQLASHLRRKGTAPGAYEPDRQNKSKIRQVLTSPLNGQLAAVRDSLTDLTAWFAKHPSDDQPDPNLGDLLESLSAQAQGMLQRWNQLLDEMKMEN